MNPRIAREYVNLLVICQALYTDLPNRSSAPNANQHDAANELSAEERE